MMPLDFVGTMAIDPRMCRRNTSFNHRLHSHCLGMIKPYQCGLIKALKSDEDVFKFWDKILLNIYIRIYIYIYDFCKRQTLVYLEFEYHWCAIWIHVGNIRIADPGWTNAQSGQPLLQVVLAARRNLEVEKIISLNVDRVYIIPPWTA